MKTPFNLRVSLIPIVFLLLFLVLLNACAKDSDLFEYAIEEEIAENIAEEENSEEDSEDTEEDASEDTIEDEEVPQDEETVDEDSNFEDTTDRSSPVKAFPTAEGYGKNATGGRGGQVISVTTNASRGSGSLHEALMTPGPRTIIFRVGGVFDIGSGFTVYGDLTIAGQTAPGDGVTITSSSGGYLEFYEGNVIIRNIRFRVGGGSGYSMFRFICNANKDITDVIFDHCSFSWADPSEMLIAFERELNNDQNNVAHEVTIQKSIFGEAGRSVLLYRGGYNFTFYQNYFYDPGFRTPMANYPFNNPSPDLLTFESINTLVHNTTSALSIGLGTKVSVVGSKLTLSPGHSYGADGFIRGESYGGCNGNCDSSSESYVYINDNNVPNGISEVSGFDLANFVYNTPYTALTVNSNDILPVSNIDEMLQHIGAYPRDNTDQNFINHYYSQTGTIGVTSGFLESYQGGTPYSDNDGDGMEDAWEINRGLDPSVPDNNGDDDGDGYTNLEEYLNYLLP